MSNPQSNYCYGSVFLEVTGISHFYRGKTEIHVECTTTGFCLDMDEKQGVFDCFSY